MKTSINVPDWLHQEAVDLNPGQAFGLLVRDALLIALPEWRKTANRTPVEKALRMQLRLEQARSGLESGRRPPAAAADLDPPGRGDPPGQESDSPPAGHQNGGPQSATKAVGRAARGGRRAR